MSPLAEFLDVLFREGRAGLRGRPDAAAGRDGEALALLRRAYSDYRLRVAGRPLEFDPAAALAAAALLQNACWFLVSRAAPDSELEKSLALPGSPGAPAEHLSADLTLRFLPTVHRRARAHDPADRLTALLADVLRRWPLSGVLSDVDDGPLTPVTFDGHAGLLMLYAERLTRHEKPAWVPEGPGREYLELAYRELGQDSPALLRAAGVDQRGEASDE
jgi:hypothetical protein